MVSTLTTEPTRLTMMYSHIYPSNYEVRMQMILPEHVSVYIWYDNNDQFRSLLLQFYLVHTRENYIISYISQYLRRMCADVIT